MSLDSIIDIQITRESSRITLAGFGRALILSVHTRFAERSKVYSEAIEMLADGFLTTDQEYLDAVALMSQSPSPVDFAVGRRATAVAMVRKIEFDGFDDGTYTVTINGTAFAFVASGSSELLIRDGLIALINAGSEPVTAAIVDADELSLTSDVAGISFTATVSGSNPTVTANMILTTTTANVGIAEDLAAIIAYDNDWYGLLIEERDSAHILEAAAAIQALKKIFLAQSNDAAILSDPYDDGDIEADIASNLKGLGYDRTALFYHPTDATPLAAAMLGRGLASVPGSMNWMFKSLIGVTAASFTTAELTNLLSKSANSTRTEAGRTMTFDGTVAEGEYIDIIHGTDHLESKIQANIFLSLLNSPKVPMTDGGIQTLAAGVKSALLDKVRDGLIAESRQLADLSYQRPGFTVTAPLVSTFSSADRAARRIPADKPIKFEGTYQGAVNRVAVRGTIAV